MHACGCYIVACGCYIVACGWYIVNNTSSKCPPRLCWDTCVLLTKFSITVCHYPWRDFRDTASNRILQGLDGRGFVDRNFFTAVLTRTCAGITATTMCGTTGYCTEL